MPEPKRGPGRPPGSRNKPKPLPVAGPSRLVPPSTDPKWDYRHADPAALIERQLTLIDWTQQALRNELTRGFGETGKFAASKDDVMSIQSMANALVRTVEALKKSSDLAEELSKRMSPEQLLEAAVRKVEGQDAATIRHYIKRLYAYLKQLGPIDGRDRQKMGVTAATDAIASLDDDES